MPGSKWKNYRKQEFSRDALTLEHSNRRDFYISSWQRGTSPFPMLLLRSIQFGAMLAIWMWSFIDFSHKSIYFVYMTHWGLTLVLITTLFSSVLSATAFFGRLPDISFGLSWYEKVYWVLYNASCSVSFLIVIFYWTVLYSTPDASMEDYVTESTPVGLDISIHGINAAVMVVELLTSSTPARLLHAVYPLCFAVAYMIFGIVYYFAGGTNTRGEPWVYEVINWAIPGRTIGIISGIAVLLLLLHVLVVAITVARDALAKLCVPDHTPPDVVVRRSFLWRQRDTSTAAA